MGFFFKRGDFVAVIGLWCIFWDIIKLLAVGLRLASFSAFSKAILSFLDFILFSSSFKRAYVAEFDSIFEALLILVVFNLGF